jgi:hypothetical protein
VENRARRIWTAGLTTLLSLAVLAGGWLLANGWRGELPDPVASHWGTGGHPNGFSSLDGVLRVMLIGGLALVLLFGAITLFLGQTGWARRVGAAGAVWSAVFLTTLVVGSLSVQRGVSDAAQAPDIGGVTLVAFGASLAAAVLVGLVVPGDPHLPTRAPIDPSAPRLDLGPRFGPTPPAFTAHVSSPAALILGLVTGLLIIGLAGVLRAWGLLVVGLVPVAVVASFSAAGVRVDDQGLTVRSPLGWPRFHVPLDEVVRADTITVRALRDFGGWGYRLGRHGRVGIVLRSGEALLVERTGGRSLAVTVDGAANAAALLNTLADRQRPPR